MPDQTDQELRRELLQRQLLPLGRATTIKDNRSVVDRLLDALIGEEASIEQEPVLGSRTLGKVLTGLDQLTYGHLKPEEGWSLGMAGDTRKGVEAIGTGIKGLYSRLTRAAQELPPKAHANRILSQLANRASQEEIQYSGIDKLLEAMGDKPVAKGEVLRHLEQNPLTVQTKTLGEPAIKGKPRRIVNTRDLPDIPYYNDRPLHEVSPFAVIEDDAVPVSFHQNRENALESLAEFPRSPDLITAPTKYSNYTLPGGENYRETLIKLPASQAAAQEAGDIQAIRDAGGRAYRAKPVENFQSPHWDDPNVLVHTRHNERTLPGPRPDIPFPEKQPTWKDLEAQGWQAEIDTDPISGHTVVIRDPSGSFMGSRGRSFNFTPEEYLHEFAIERAINNYNDAINAPTGPRGRFIEEIQSDWHQQGKASGYRTPEVLARQHEVAQRAEKAATEFNQFIQDYAQERGLSTADPTETYLDIQRNLMASNTTTPEGMAWWNRSQRYHQLDNVLKAANEEYEAIRPHLNIPDAPFKDAWPDLALKQQIMDVAERPDLDWLGFTASPTQINRYDLSRHVSRIDYTPDRGVLVAYDPSGRAVIEQADVTPEKLADYIGVDAASRLMQTQPARHLGYAQTPVYTLAGEDLQIGGEGMRQFYDQLLPARLEKILKPFGGRVEQGQVDALPSGAVRQHNPQLEEAPAWIARLTPEMKERIKREGLPLIMLLAMLSQSGATTTENPDAK